MHGGLSLNAVPKMEIARYLDLIQPIRTLKRFRLVNQEVKNGFVYFGDAAAMKRLNEIIRFNNTGERPIEFIVDKEGKVVRNDSTITKDTPNIYEHRDCLDGLKGPDGGGWYTSRCPVCEYHGGDSDKNHFRFMESGVFSCFAGHEGWEVFEWLTAFIQGRQPVFDKKGSSVPDLSDDAFDNWMTKKEAN